MSASKWFISTDAVSKPGSPKTAGPFSTLEDALTARVAVESMYGNYSVFEEVAPPAVELPTKPTLGWVTDGRSPRLAHWSVTDRGLHLRSSLGASAGGVCVSRETHVENVTAFTPATAVPTEALDALRRSQDEACVTFGAVAKNELRRDAVSTFLAAADQADGGAS